MQALPQRSLWRDRIELGSGQADTGGRLGISIVMDLAGGVAGHARFTLELVLAGRERGRAKRETKDRVFEQGLEVDQMSPTCVV